MFGFKNIVIAQHERGLFLRDGRLEDVLEPGRFRWFDPFSHLKVEVFDLTEAAFGHPRVDFFLKDSPALFERYFHLLEMSEHEVGLVYMNNSLASVLPPATRQFYWKGPVEVRVEKLDISKDSAVPADKLKAIAYSRDPQLIAAGREYLYLSEVESNHVGLLSVDGELTGSLEPGLYGFWKFNRKVSIEQLDLRMQAMEVNGQEILTRDKVSLRANLSASYQIVDAVKVRSTVKDFADFLYRELQFGLRQAIGTNSLDLLLSNKGELDEMIAQYVADKAVAHGIKVCSVGVKDLILPGDMKDILNKVVEAEKVAQANVIKRREETAATRSLLNTAKIMDENPTLKRLKELEVLEKVAEKVDRLTVFGGMDGVLNDTVKIDVRAE